MKQTILTLFFLINFSLLGQAQFIKNQQVQFLVGVADENIEKFEADKNLDFLDYVDNNSDYVDFIIAKLVYKFDYLEKMSANITLILMDDLAPDNYDISTHYRVRPWLELGVGSMLNKNYITYYEKYHTQLLPDYYLLSSDGQQFTNYDLSFYFSPAFNLIDYDIFKLKLKCNIGLSSFLSRKAASYHKKKLANKIVVYDYKTNTTLQPYVQPKLELELRALKINDVSVGLVLNSSFYYSQRSINYQRTIREWTYDNSTTEQIKSRKHNYSRFELDAGIFVRW